VSPSAGIVGWDLGGAHLKLAMLNAGGGVERVAQFATPLWQGLERLEGLLHDLAQRLPLAEYEHVLTMTGELVDLFEDRAQGVAVLAEIAAAALPPGRLHLYGGPEGFVAPHEARAHCRFVASANWYATAAWLAGQLPYGVLVDVGSTTSDVLAFADGAVQHRGYSDRERLASEELVYQGVVRTPLMAVVQRVPFFGEWLRLANEHFATMADVYRILGWLPEHADLHPSADGRAKDVTASMRRLARMLGADLADGDAHAWHGVAAYIADRQLDTLALTCQRQLSRLCREDVPLVGAGSGRFLVARLARRLDRRYTDVEGLLGSARQGDIAAADCAPAVAVARLARMEDLACAC
jgi:probable H4MPT-linked C1 transfer pathway protein